MILQLNPALPFKHIDKGNFLAHFLVDYGMESEIYFIGILEESGEIWCYSNRVLRAQKNISLGRTFDENPFHEYGVKEYRFSEVKNPSKPEGI